MAVPFEIRVGNLLSEFLAHTLIVFRPFAAARAIPSRPFKSFPYRVDYIFIFVQSYHTTII